MSVEIKVSYKKMNPFHLLFIFIFFVLYIHTFILFIHISKLQDVSIEWEFLSDSVICFTHLGSKVIDGNFLTICWGHVSRKSRYISCSVPSAQIRKSVERKTFKLPRKPHQCYRKILTCTNVCWNLNGENFEFCLQNDLEADNCKFLLRLQSVQNNCIKKNQGQ